MYCAYCGSQVREGQSFCSRCGRAISVPGAAGTAAQGVALGAPPVAAPAGVSASPATSAAAPQQGWTAPGSYVSAAARSRLQCHLRTLGILWIVGSALRMIPSLGMLFFGRMGFLFMPWHARAFVLPIIGGIGAFMTAAAAAGIAAGWGLLDRRPWARTLALVLGCLALIDFPFGTALGIYTLWVLFSAGADLEYERLSLGH